MECGPVNQALEITDRHQEVMDALKGICNEKKHFIYLCMLNLDYMIYVFGNWKIVIYGCLFLLLYRNTHPYQLC